MSQHMLSAPNAEFTDLRKTDPDSVSHQVGPKIFTANAAGTTTTIKGADATLATGVNVVRVGERCVVQKSDGTLRDPDVVKVTSVASVTGVTTVTFTPAVVTATASGDVLLPVGPVAYTDNDSLDARLKAINAGLYTQAYLDGMTQNDKVYAIRLADDPNSL